MRWDDVVRDRLLAQPVRVSTRRSLPITELTHRLSSESLCRVVHLSPPHAETLDDSQGRAQTGQGEDLYFNRIAARLSSW